MRLISPLRKNWIVLEDIFGCHNRERDMTTSAKKGQKLKDILECTEQNSSTHKKDHLTESVNTKAFQNFTYYQYCVSVWISVYVVGRSMYEYICVCMHVESEDNFQVGSLLIPWVLRTELRWSGLQQQAPLLSEPSHWPIKAFVKRLSRI